MQIAQIAGIIRYEILIHWRRRMLPLILAGLVGGITLLVIIEGHNLIGASPAQIVQGLSTVLFPVGMTFSWVLPILVADSIPRDRLIGTQQLLFALPMSPASYLTGKILAVWLSYVGGSAVILLVLGGWVRLALGAYDVSAYLEQLFIAVLPLLLMTTGVSVLLASGQPNRRPAVFAALGFILAFNAIGLTYNGTALDLLIRQPFALMLHYALRFGETGTLVYSGGELLLAVAALAAELGLVWLITWGLFRRQDTWRAVTAS